MNTPEIHDKISVRRAIMEVRVTSLSNNQNAKVIEVEIDTKEHMVLEELVYEVAETYITRTETVLHTRVIQEIRVTEFMDHG